MGRSASLYARLGPRLERSHLLLIQTAFTQLETPPAMPCPGKVHFYEAGGHVRAPDACEATDRKPGNPREPSGSAATCAKCCGNPKPETLNPKPLQAASRAAKNPLCQPPRGLAAFGVEGPRHGQQEGHRARAPCLSSG